MATQSVIKLVDTYDSIEYSKYSLIKDKYSPKEIAKDCNKFITLFPNLLHQIYKILYLNSLLDKDIINNLIKAGWCIDKPADYSVDNAVDTPLATALHDNKIDISDLLVSSGA